MWYTNLYRILAFHADPGGAGSMKKRIVSVILVGTLLLPLCIYGSIRYNSNRYLNAKPLLIMIDGTLYGIGGSVDNRPDAPPDGTIKEVIDRNDVPDTDSQANFGAVGMPYWQVGTKIVVESGQYYVFNELKHQE